MVAVMLEHFRRTVEISAPAAVVWGFHERPDALQLLTPPWLKVEVVAPPRSLAVGTRVEMKMHVGPVPITIVAVHVKYEAGRMFADRMTRGPFKSWLHHHIVEPTETGARLIDDVEYELPGGWIGRTVAGGSVRRSLERQFNYRHEVTRKICEEEALRTAPA